MTLNHLEGFLDSIEESGEDGLSHILDLYHRYWLHGEQEVSLKDPGGSVTRGVVKSLDPEGFLAVQLIPDGKIVSVHPDGNSFDMMQGLIQPKMS